MNEWKTVSNSETLIINIKRSEYFSCFSHLAGAIATLIGLALLIAKSRGETGFLIVSLLYGLSMCSMFTFSALYHANKHLEDATNIWRKLDHIAIFFMIAGSYSPLCYIYLSGAWHWSILVIAWSFVVAGIILKLFFIKAPRIFSTLIYISMGWIAIIPVKQLWQSMPHVNFFLILGGGVAYSIGALFYAIKKPNPFPKVFGFHEIFHLLILVGALLHYVAINLSFTLS